MYAELLTQMSMFMIFKSVHYYLFEKLKIM